MRHKMMKWLCDRIDTYCARRGWMISCVALDGSMAYVGNLRTAYYLYVQRGIAPELRTQTSKVCSIGYCKREGKWYGWSHRAIAGFLSRTEAAEFAESVS